MALVALLGAGIFAREEHLAAIDGTDTLVLGAVYSRTQASAEALVGGRKKTKDGTDTDTVVALYYDSPPTPGRSLDDLLRRADIAAVIVALPILVQPAVVKRALAAGKHVLSEKPIAADVAAARDLLAFHGGLAAVPAPIWAVAENFRFLEVVTHAAGLVRALGGRVVTFSVQMYTQIGEDDKFFQTEWRKVPGYQGGFLLDGGVHFIAGLRCLLAAAAGGEDIARVAAFSALLQPALAPVDTVQAVLATTGGSIGSFGVSFGTAFKAAFAIEVVTTRGAVTLTPTAVTSRSAAGETQREFSFSAGVQPEVAAFGHSLRAGGGAVDARQSPQQALQDLAVLEALLRSAERGGEPVVVGDT